MSLDLVWSGRTCLANLGVRSCLVRKLICPVRSSPSAYGKWLPKLAMNLLDKLCQIGPKPPPSLSRYTLHTVVHICTMYVRNIGSSVVYCISSIGSAPLLCIMSLERHEAYLKLVS